VQVTAFAGLHPNDKTAEVSVTLAPDDAAALAAASGGAGGSAPSIYNAVTTFEAGIEPGAAPRHLCDGIHCSQ
jgi:hypothetical protein